jgi:hypothetical protein
MVTSPSKSVKMGSEIRPGPGRVAVGERVTSGRVIKGAQRVPDWGLPKDAQCRKSYTNKKRIEILHLKRTEVVPVPELGYDAKRKPTWAEIERLTGVPKNTASKWPALEDEILRGREMGRQNNPEDRCPRPELEERVFQQFHERRAKGNTVRRD